VEEGFFAERATYLITKHYLDELKKKKIDILMN